MSKIRIIFSLPFVVIMAITASIYEFISGKGIYVKFK